MTTWKDIDPEARDLSTPELWDAWREEVGAAIPSIDKWTSEPLRVDEQVLAVRGSGWSMTKVHLCMKNEVGTMTHLVVDRP